MSAGRRIKPDDDYHFPSTTSRKEFFRGGSDKEFRESIYNMVRALEGFMSCREMFSKALGLTGSQFAVLMGVAMKQESDGVTIRDLADHIRLAAPHATTEVGRLMRKKLLVKRPNEADGRSVLVSLSPFGEAEVDRIVPLVRKVNDSLFQGIEVDELRMVSKTMKTLVLNSQRVLAELRWGDMLDMVQAVAPASKTAAPRKKAARLAGARPSARRAA